MGWNAPAPTVNCTSGDVGTPRHDGAAGWGGGSRVEYRAGEAGRCQPAAADDTELAVEPNWPAVNWVVCVDGGLLGQILGGSSGLDGLEDFGLPHLLLGELLVLLPLLGQDPPGSSLLRFRRPGLRRHLLLAPRKDGGSGGGGLDRGLGDLIYDRARYGGGSAGGGVHLHGCVWAGVACRPSGRGKIRQSASVGWAARGGQEGRAGERACCPGRRISGPNLRLKWVHADKFGPCCLFGSGHWDAISSFFCPRGRVRTWGGRMGRPAGDALSMKLKQKHIEDLRLG
jgi:hypothetical protein